MRVRTPLSFVPHSKIPHSGVCSYPESVVIEVTKQCNLTCKMCYRASTTYSAEPAKRDMALADFKKVIDQLRNTRSLWLTGGEAMLNHDLPQMIAYASHQLRPFIGLTTNGTLLTEEVAQTLATSGLNALNVSIDSPHEETFREIRGTSLEEIVAHIRYLKSEAPHISVGINTVIMRENVGQLQGILLLAREVGAERVAFQLVHKWNEYFLDFGIYDRLILEEIEAEILKKCESYGLECSFAKYKGIKSFYCYNPFFECYIDYKGRITPCCTVVNEPLTSSIFQSTFINEWNSEPMKRLRKQLLKREFPDYCCCSVLVCAKRISGTK